MVTNKFNKRFPQINIPNEIVQLRDAIAHGVIAEINGSETSQLLKFKENKRRELVVEFSMPLEKRRLSQIRQSLKEFRRFIMAEIKDK